jgi:hypothetical protein
MHVANTITTATVGGTLLGWLPPIAALFAIVWYALQIWESRTVQGWLSRRPASAEAKPWLRPGRRGR